MKVRYAASLVLATCLPVGSANASSIGPFFSSDASFCDAVVMPFTPFNTYIVAVLGGDAAGGGLSGAEFRLDGIDPAWFNTVNPSPIANLALGNPIAGGCNIAFPGCMGGATVLLYTIQSLALAPITGQRILSVTRHTTPSNPNFQCALVTLCDAPVFTKLCVRGGQAFLNGGVCTIGVEQKSWTAVKQMFH